MEKQQSNDQIGSFICALCGAISRGETDSLDSGTALKCEECGGYTIVLLCTSQEYERIIASDSLKS